MAYTASLATTPGRPGFSISFRHPCRLDSKGKPGLKMRRGLGTDDKIKGQELVAQMNQLLQDESWWTAARYSDALAIFDKRIVDAFYDSIQAGVRDSTALRDEVIAMPGKDEGYAKVLFVGTTGAGKTSLLRHLIGSDPGKDRFPSTSAAKTTVSDIEVIPAAGPYRAAVTFFPEPVIQANIEDCVLNACSAVWDHMSEDKVADRFLHHPDQRFRLSYLLGSWKKGAQAEENADEWDFGEAEPAAVAADDEAVTKVEAEKMQTGLEDYVARITALASTKGDAIAQELLPDSMSASAEDRDAALEIFQSELFADEAFHDIVQDVMDEALLRFDQLSDDDLTRRSATSRWPLMWTYETEDRDEFLRQVRWFSSNFAPSFGKLLTPLVDGIRVQGPLFPVYNTARQAKLVLLDGQGLGHTPDSSTSVTTHITRRFAEVDAILLVDNAEQPVQAAAQSVLRSVASSGNYNKLLIAFTHFDQVKGLNLPSYKAKRQHVLASVHNYLTKLREVLNGPIVAAIERGIDDQCYMLGALQGPLKALPPGVCAQLNAMVGFLEKSVEPPPIPDAQPEYDSSDFGFTVQRAVDSFQKAWAVRLNLAIGGTLQPEHWTRIKALNRRISNEMNNYEYDSLRPVADLVARITEEISNFLDHPIAWNRQPVNDDEAQQAIAPIRQAVFNDMHKLALERLVQQHLNDWRRSEEYKGKGSASRRAMDIRGIYELAAPIPGKVNSEPFLRNVREIVDAAVKKNGGLMRP